jgi:hypothetical protein
LSAVETNAWRRVAFKDISTNTRIITTPDFSDYNNLHVIMLLKRGTSQIANDIYFDGINSGSKYCRLRRTNNTVSQGASENTVDVRGDEANDRYITFDMENWSGEEKILYGHLMIVGDDVEDQQDIQFGAKYVEKSGQINNISVDARSGQTFGSGSYIAVYASTPNSITDEKTTISNVEAGTRFYETDTRKIYRAKSVGFANGTSGSGSDWTEVAFDSSTSANNGTASGNVVTRSSYPSSGDWTSYIRSSTHYLDPSEGGGEVYFTVSNNTHVSMGLEKSPYNSHPSDVYQSKDYSFHTTTATNNIYESTSYYDGTDWNNATNEWRITMDSAGEVKYYYRANSSSSWNLERTSTVTASGKYYVSVSVYSTASCTCYIKSDATIAWKERGTA